MRFPTLTFLLALCCGLTNGCSEGVTRRTAATILSVKGDVVFGMGEQNNFQPVTRWSRIYDGSVVRTPEGALLDLGLNGSVLAQISGNSEIQIEELKVTKDGNETRGGVRSRSALVRLNRGKLTVLFSGSGRSTSQFAISTLSVTVTADSDSLFSIESNDTVTRVTCVRGKIYVATDGRSPVAIDAGCFQQWPLTRPEPVAASENAAAQIDITDAFKAEDNLLKMDADWRDRRPF